MHGDAWRQATKGYCIKCDKCGAEAKEYISPYGVFETEPGDKMRRVVSKFTSLGWKVGKVNTCPSCVREGRAAQMRFIHASKGDTAMKSNDLDKLGLVPLGGLGPGGRIMDRSDRRVIFNKIDEFYGDEKTGYKIGWTDQKVATDLGVPLAWVKAVREENFGPVSSNPEIDAVLAEAKKWKDEEGILKRKTETLIEHMNKQAEEVRKLGEELKKHSDKGEMIERSMFRIAKVVRP